MEERIARYYDEKHSVQNDQHCGRDPLVAAEDQTDPYGFPPK